MDLINRKTQGNHRKMERRALLLVILYITQVSCQTESQRTKIDIDSTQCHSCSSSNKHTENLLDSVVDILSTFRENDYVNKTIDRLENEVERLLDKALSKDRYKIFDGIEIKPDGEKKLDKRSLIEDPNEERALFSKFTYEYRLLQKVKNFVNTHIVSINLPKAAEMIGFRSFGLNKFLLPLFIGGQVLFKSILLAMFLPSILGSFGKILGKDSKRHASTFLVRTAKKWNSLPASLFPQNYNLEVFKSRVNKYPLGEHILDLIQPSGISQLSASSSQASYPPINGEDQTSYNNDNNKDVMGYESNQAGTYVFPDTYGTVDPNEVNEVGNVDMSRFGIPGQQMPSKNSYYQNQMTANNYKVFQKIPASSMILSNYDPFYSPLLSRLDGIFARLGLAPSENDINDGMQIGGQSLTDVKLEACREQLICLMYSTPAKYAPYSNLVSAQLSRELNELRRPVSDNPEILRFFRYMRAARRGQEGVNCMQSFPACSTNAAPSHTMIAAYHDINKLVTARKLRNH